MKTFTLICFGLLFNSVCNSQDFSKLKDSEVDSKSIEFSKKFANDYLTKQRAGSYYQFTNEAIEQLKAQLTEANQKNVYNQIKSQFGDYKSLEYAETWIQKDNSSYKIFRLKGTFEKSNKKLEIRVVLDNNNKIEGFWIRPWSDMLN